jgi:ribosomal protein S18 acetylase RimI-like enzyme
MATDDLKDAPIHAIPLDELAPADLAGVFEAQRRDWVEQLDWDLAPVVNLIADALRASALRGVAVFAGPKPVGYGFFSVEIDRCLIGDVFVIPEWRSEEVNGTLALGLLEQIERARPRKRVESQSIIFDARGIDEVFSASGFNRHTRKYMVADLAGADFADPPPHERVRLREWQSSDFNPAAEVVYQAYRGTVDARVNCQYRTREGCADLLDALTDSPWCGRFDGRLTRVAVDVTTGRVCGVAVVSAISTQTAHLGQISVLPAYQGSGVGAALVRSALALAERAGFARASLAVTAENAVAGRLYERCGFATRREFSIYTRAAGWHRNQGG